MASSTYSLKWALDDLLWLLVLGLEEDVNNYELQRLKIGKSIFLLISFLQRLVYELLEILTMHLSVQWHSRERYTISEVSSLLEQIEGFLASVFSCCVKLEDQKLCSQLKILTLRTFDAQQLLRPLETKCIVASRYVEIEESQLKVLEEELVWCLDQLDQISTKNPISAPLTNMTLREVFDKIQVHDISHLSGYSAMSATLSVFSDVDSLTLKHLQELSCRIDALKFSMVFLKQQVNEFHCICSEHFPQSSVQLKKLFAKIDVEWDAVQTQFTSYKANLLDKNCNVLFTFLIEETVTMVKEIYKRNKQTSGCICEDDRLNLRLCSGVINFIHNAFKEELIADPYLPLKYNGTLLVEWEKLNQALDNIDGTESCKNTPLELRSLFDEIQNIPLVQSPDSLRSMVLKESDSVAPSKLGTPDTTPGNTPLHEFSRTNEKKIHGLSQKPTIGLGLNLGLEFDQCSAVPLSVVKKERILSLNLKPTDKGVKLLGKLTHLIDNCEDECRLGSPMIVSRKKSRSQIPTIVHDYMARKLIRIEKMESCGSRIPVISRTHTVFSGAHLAQLNYTPQPEAKSNDSSQEMSFLYSTLRTPPRFELNLILQTSTPCLSLKPPSTAAKYCLGLMSPNNTLDSVAERYSLKVLEWGSRPLLRRMRAAMTPTTKLERKPWK